MMPSQERDAAARYEPWLDWLKVIGMVLILLGHAGGDALVAELFNPINFKQIGVALFVFVSGYTLAGETRSGPSVVYRRFFDVFILGLLLSVLLSAASYLYVGDVNESNYLPYFFGVNVFWENAFPANPTTWYVGTYFHLLILWAILLRWWPRSWWSLLILTFVEVGFRAYWIAVGRDFTAYMVVTSWLVVFYFGGRWYQFVSSRPATYDWSISLRVTALLMSFLLLALWSHFIGTFEISKRNPFGRVGVGPPWMTSLATSVSVSFLYVACTLVIVGFVFNAVELRIVRFLAKNTLLVFLAHMPVRDLVTPLYYSFVEPGWVRQIANFLILFCGLAVVSEGLYRVFRFTQLRRWIAERWSVKYVPWIGSFRSRKFAGGGRL